MAARTSADGRIIMSVPLLLDEMFSDAIAQQLRAKGFDVSSVVAQPALVGLPDDQILAYATSEGRALVTANIKDLIPLDSRCRAAGQDHPWVDPGIHQDLSPGPQLHHSDRSCPCSPTQRHGQDSARPGALPHTRLAPTSLGSGSVFELALFSESRRVVRSPMIRRG